MVLDYFHSRNQREFAIIAAFVCACHILLVFWLGYVSNSTPRWEAPTKKVVVRTVTLSPKKNTGKIQKPAAANRPAPKKTETKIEKVEVKPVPKKIEAKPVAEKTAKVPSKKQQDLLASAKESISQIQENRSKMTYQTVSSSVKAELPAVEKNETDELLEFHYKEELAARLRLFLRLPEYGEVSIRLTLARTGAVEKLEILDVQSKANRRYVEESVPALYFPAFGEYFPGEKNHVFTITLRND